MKECDAIDRGILDRVTRNPGVSIGEAIRPFLARRSETVLRQRVRALEIRKEIKFKRTKHEVLCFRENPAAEDGSDV